jgi:hypothetical protein
MAIIRSSNGSDIIAVEVDPTYAAMMASYRAPEVGTGGGYYRMTLNSGTLAGIAAAGIFFAFQNPSPNIILVQNVSVGFRPVAGVATQNSMVVSMYPTRSYTVLDATGAAGIVQQKGQMLTQTRATQMNSFLRISNTGALSGGTGTDDAQPIASNVFNHPGIVSAVGLTTQQFFQVNPAGVSTPNHPFIIAQNEGFRLRFDQAMLAGNTMVAFVDVEWLECSAF